ncbi:hypothetical protein CLOM_g12104 [Closterium sp. NIES-68]|nr:hypothetical protein CLOM_g12104 [Closterium sp. NIES-68]GJP58024.1 hypothetical protein CLOP_g20099 [Closterium sp. NIES-67]
MTIPNPIFPSASRADVRSRYRLGKELGKGGGGVVRVCGDLATGEPVAACKSIPKCKLQRKEAREELQGEVAAMRRVGGHAHVVALRALFEDAESVHLVMDLCAQGDLYEYLIARTVLPEPMAADVTRQILLALHHCHASGVVHRDIKPENILLASKDEAAEKLHLKLADFGLAVQLRAGQLAVGMYGSAVYMSPEVVCRRPYGPPVDMWGLGVILYTALSGYMPFWGSTDEQLFFRILRNQPDFSIAPWPSVSPTAIDLVRWLLSSDPAHRPSAAAALQHPWIAQHCGRQTLPPHRPAPPPSMGVSAPGLPGEAGSAEGGREERVKPAQARGVDGPGSGTAAAAAGGAMDTEMGGQEEQRKRGMAAGAEGVVRVDPGSRQGGRHGQQNEEAQRQERAGGTDGSMDVDSQQAASVAHQDGREKQPKPATLQVPLFPSFTGPASPLFSSPARNGTGSAGGGGVFLFTARPNAGSSKDRGSGGSMWDRGEGSKGKHKEQQRHQAQRHAHASKQHEQHQASTAAAAAAAGDKEEQKERHSNSGAQAAEQKPRRSSHFRFFSPKRKARRSHVVVSAAPLPAPPPPPLSSPSSSRHSTLDPSLPHSTAAHSSSEPTASITVPLVRRPPASGDAAAPSAAAAASSQGAAGAVASVTIPVIPPKPPLDPTQDLPSVPEIQARLSGPDGSIPVSSLFSSFLRPLNPLAARKPSFRQAQRSESSPVPPSPTPSAPPNFLYSPREPLKSPLKSPHHKPFTATSSYSGTSSTISASSAPRVASASELSFGMGRFSRPLQGMSSLIRPSSPSTSASALAPSPCESPQHIMGAGQAGGSVGGEEDGSRRAREHTALTSSASAPNVAMPSSAAPMPAVPHVPRRARGLSSIVRAFASLSTTAANAAAPGPVVAGQQPSGSNMAAVAGGASVEGGTLKVHQESVESPSASQARTFSEGTARGTEVSSSSIWQRQGSWIFRR